MTQESAPMPERDVSPATKAGRALLDAMFADEGGMPIDPGAAILAIEQEAAAIERRKVVERIRKAYRHTDSYRLDEHGRDLDAILDELSPSSSDRGASR